MLRRYFSQRLELAYLEWGNPENPPLILLHGGRDHARSWDRFARELAADWRVICPDMRGHGDSAWSPDAAYGLENMVLDLAGLIDLLGLTQVALVGHSLGGNVCLRYAGIWPEKVTRLVSIEGIGPSPQARAERDATPIAERFRAWASERNAGFAKAPRLFDDMADARQRMRAAHPRLSEEDVDHLTVHALRGTDDGRWQWKFDPLLSANAPVDLGLAQMRELWNAIACPVLLFWGEESWASNPAEDGRAAYFRDARVVAVPGAAHWLHYDRPELFLAELRAFLAITPPAAPREHPASSG